MRKNGLLVFVFIMFSALLLASCDSRGSLSSEETEKLYCEVKELFTTGEIFNYQAKPPQEVNTVDKPVNESDIEFIKSLAELVFDESNQLGKYGAWFDSKHDVRICNINCSLPMQYDGNDCIVEQFSATMNKTGACIINVVYRFDGILDGNSQRLLIRFEPS